ncbi:P-loop containing nucleoside triphosphate hydrolase protein [Meredithblackwellia eburnea MCA 4105]
MSSAKVSDSRRDLRPDEVVIRQDGVYTSYRFLIGGKTKRSFWGFWALFLSYPKEFWRRLVVFYRRLPLLLKVIKLLSATGGKNFWFLVLGKALQAFIPAIELHYSQQLLDLAKNAGSTSRRVVGSVLARRILASALTHAVGRLYRKSEQIVNGRFINDIQMNLIRLKLRMSEREKEDPLVRKRIGQLEKLSYMQLHHFNPLSGVSLIQSMLTLVGQFAILRKQVNKENMFVLCFAALSVFIDQWDGEDPNDAVVCSNDSFKRWKVLRNMAESSRLRREIDTLQLSEYLIQEAETSNAEVGDLRTSNQPHTEMDFKASISSALTALTWAMVAVSPGRGTSTFADVTSLNMISASIISEIWSMRYCWSSIEEGAECTEAYLSCLGMDHPRRRAGTPYVKAIGSLGQGIELEFQNVSVTYPGALKPALSNVSFKVRAGELVSIIGPSGCGKSTLISLLTLTQKPTEGIILVNGVPIESYDPADLMRAFSFTFQSSPFFPMSIEESVSLGAIGAPNIEDRVEQALELAGASTFVRELKDGANSYCRGSAGMDGHGYPSELPQTVSRAPITPTVEPYQDDADSDDIIPVQETAGVWSSLVETEGKKYTVRYPSFCPAYETVSGGQWQRIALARSLMKQDSDLLVWDEPAASLDPVSEADLFNVILGLKGQKTIIFSTHRYNVTPKADLLLFFAEGKLIESGTHAELVRIPDGQYQKMWNLQAEGYLTSTPNDAVDSDESEEEGEGDEQ